MFIILFIPRCRLHRFWSYSQTEYIFSLLLCDSLTLFPTHRISRWWLVLLSLSVNVQIFLFNEVSLFSWTFEVKNFAYYSCMLHRYFVSVYNTCIKQGFIVAPLSMLYIIFFSSSSFTLRRRFSSFFFLFIIYFCGGTATDKTGSVGYVCVCFFSVGANF